MEEVPRPGTEVDEEEYQRRLKEWAPYGAREEERRERKGDPERERPAGH